MEALNSLSRLRPLAAGLNAYSCSFDDRLLEPLRQSCVRNLQFLRLPANRFIFAGGKQYHQAIEPDNGYYLVTFNTSPLLWLSANDESTFALFQSFFQGLGLEAELMALADCEAGVRLYSAFFVIGTHMPDHLWHVDYLEGANAYTLITPLLEIDAAHGHLLYECGDGTIGQYRYRRGEAVVFGEGFRHCTEPYAANGRMRVLVSLAFGTDKTEYWPILKQTLGRQCAYLILPCGHLQGSCECIEDPFVEIMPAELPPA